MLSIGFLLVAVVCLLLGVLLGIAMGIAESFQLAPVHAHLNLVGWASMALFGLAYRAWPRLAEGRLARLHFFLTAPAAPLMPIGAAISILFHKPAQVIGASIAFLAGVICFLVNVVRLAWPPPALPGE